MVPEVGHFALIIAFVIAVLQTFFPIAGAARGNAAWIGLTKPLAQAQLLFVTLSYFCLTYAFLTNDFTVTYAVNHSNSDLPLLYKISGVWGGHEGSLLLWVFFLNVWTVAVVYFSQNLDDAMLARVVGVLGFVSVGFMMFMLVTSNPFDRTLPGAVDGRDLNPLLQDPGLAIHPPMLYLGYVGFSVAFAFAIAALLSGKLDAAWARWSRPWTTIAWVFLTFGIALGSWWAYYELGWGGWWFWDPVENASFIPWLIGTALIHSLSVSDKRGTFRNWTVLLAISAFALCLLGTFLVRSGVLVSVHSFAADPDRGLAILIYLLVVIGISLALYAWRAPKVGFGGDFKLASRETMLLSGNVMLSVAAAAVLLGTVFPLIHDALDLGKLSVGPPYFDAIFIPLMVPVIFLMGIGPLARWKQTSIPEIKTRLKWALVAGVVGAIVIPMMMGGFTFMIGLGVLLAVWVIAASIANVVTRIKSMSGDETALQKLAKQPLQYYGMLTAHIGVGVFIFGVTMVSGYEQEKDVRMDIGDFVTIDDYTFRFDGVMSVPGPNYRAERGTIVVTKNEKVVAVLHPEKRVYKVQTNPMTEAAIESHLTHQVYVALGEPISDGAWSVRVYLKPFVTWIWTGCFIMGVGGILAISDRRYRISSRKAKKTPAKTAEQSGDSDLAAEGSSNG